MNDLHRISDTDAEEMRFLGMNLFQLEIWRLDHLISRFISPICEPNLFTFTINLLQDANLQWTSNISLQEAMCCSSFSSKLNQSRSRWCGPFMGDVVTAYHYLLFCLWHRYSLCRICSPQASWCLLSSCMGFIHQLKIQ